MSVRASDMFHLSFLLFCLRQMMLSLDIQSTLALRTPRYNGHPDNTDSS